MSQRIQLAKVAICAMKEYWQHPKHPSGSVSRRRVMHADYITVTQIEQYVVPAVHGAPRLYSQ